MNSTTIIAGLTPCKLRSWSATSTAWTTSRAERYSSKIEDYDHAALRLAPNQAPVLDLHETDHPNPQVHDPQFRLTGRTHRGMSGCTVHGQVQVIA